MKLTYSYYKGFYGMLRAIVVVDNMRKPVLILFTLFNGTPVALDDGCCVNVQFKGGYNICFISRSDINIPEYFSDEMFNINYHGSRLVRFSGEGLGKKGSAGFHVLIPAAALNNIYCTNSTGKIKKLEISKHHETLVDVMNGSTNEIHGSSLGIGGRRHITGKGWKIW